METQGQPKQGTGSAEERLQQQNEGTNPDPKSPGQQAAGGHGGYSSDEEQKQVNRENEKMHNERDEQDLDTSEEQKVQPGKNEGTPTEGQGKAPGLGK